MECFCLKLLVRAGGGHRITNGPQFRSGPPSPSLSPTQELQVTCNYGVWVCLNYHSQYNLVVVSFISID